MWTLEYVHFDGLVQESYNSIANALELRLSCTNPSICYILYVPVPVYLLVLPVSNGTSRGIILPCVMCREAIITSIVR